MKPCYGAEQELKFQSEAESATDSTHSNKTGRCRRINRDYVTFADTQVLNVREQSFNSMNIYIFLHLGNFYLNLGRKCVR